MEQVFIWTSSFENCRVLPSFHSKFYRSEGKVWKTVRFYCILLVLPYGNDGKQHLLGAYTDQVGYLQVFSCSTGWPGPSSGQNWKCRVFLSSTFQMQLHLMFIDSDNKIQNCRTLCFVERLCRVQTTFLPCL